MKDLMTVVKESKNPYNGMPNVITLGDGIFEGTLSAHCFTYNDKEYYSELGWKCPFPLPCKMEIKNNNAYPYSIK